MASHRRGLTDWALVTPEASLPAMTVMMMVLGMASTTRSSTKATNLCHHSAIGRPRASTGPARCTRYPALAGNTAGGYCAGGNCAGGGYCGDGYCGVG